MDTGHWYFPTSFDPSSAVGFVYRITNKLTGKAYIGKKNFWSVTRKAVKGKKRKVRITKESDWKTYCSSSKEVQEDIRIHSEDNFLFHIISLHKTKQELDYAEAKLQWQLNVVSSKLPDGTKAFYNKRTEVLRFNQYTSEKVIFTP